MFVIDGDLQVVIDGFLKNDVQGIVQTIRLGVVPQDTAKALIRARFICCICFSIMVGS